MKTCATCLQTHHRWSDAGASQLDCPCSCHESDFVVTFRVRVTADSPWEAARMALKSLAADGPQEPIEVRPDDEDEEFLDPEDVPL